MINRNALDELRKANLRNKRMIQAKRSAFAQTRATLSNIKHQGKFPTKYKYG